MPAGLLKGRYGNEFPAKVKFETTHKYYAVFLANTAELGKSLQTRIGLRYDYATAVEEGELSPRFSVSYKLDELTAIEGSWGVVYQYPDPITVSIRDQPVNFGANVEVITAEKATHNVHAAVSSVDWNAVFVLAFNTSCMFSFLQCPPAISARSPDRLLKNSIVLSVGARLD